MPDHRGALPGGGIKPQAREAASPERKLAPSARRSHTLIMLGRRAIACLLAIVVLLLGTAWTAAPCSAGVDHGTEYAITQDMPGDCSDCDHGQLPTSMRCQASCLGIAASFLTLPLLLLPTPAIGWMSTTDVRGSGRELAPDLPPPKHSRMA